MKPELDGTGGGYGRYKGYTIVEISQQFRTLEETPSARSLSAVLRITREQLDARGHLGSYRWVAAVSVFALAISVVLWFAIPIAAHPTVLKALVVSGLMTLVFGSAAFTTREATHRAIAQEREIRRLATATIIKIGSAEGFRARELDRVERQTLSELIKKTGASDPVLTSLLA